MGTVHFLRSSDRSHVSSDLLAKHQLMLDEVREIHQKSGGLIDQSNALLDADLLAIGTDPNYKYDNGVQERLDELRTEREDLLHRAEVLIKRAAEYLEWHAGLFKDE